ncbi:MAG: hypothetical protein WC709_04130 [Thermoleophilia bacterium]
MLGRIFGRGKDEPDKAVCAACGRTLLAGEWTQRVPEAGGEERIVCSLCAQTYAGEADVSAAGPTPANNGRVRESRTESRSESNAFWKALKDKDAEIEALQGQLARAEAEKQELAGQLARLRAQVAGEPAAAAPSGDVQSPGEPLQAEAPAEFAGEIAALREEASDAAAPTAASEDTQPLPALTDAQVDAAAPAAAATSAAAAAAAVPDSAAVPSGEVPEAAAAIEEEAGSLTLLQRGVDLLNVSRVPAKIAETNEQLGMPSVHVGFDGQTVAVTFMWSMGWYRFHVDGETGAVRMADRGYDELTGLQPNAGVRADGSVQLAPAQISRAAAQRPAAAQTPPAAARLGEPESPSIVAQKPPEILSKSLLGQRSDDEASSWDQTQAREFNWDR